jgi:hypothetical protein
VRQGVPLVVWSGVPVRDHVFRNNLFIGTGDQISDWTSKNFNVDLDYDGYGPGKGRFKIGNQNYGNLQAAAKDGLEAHGKLVDPPFFAKEVQIPAQSAERVKLVELDLDPRCGAVDAGVRLPNVNDGFKGAAPDLGARELGLAAPQFGPRPEGMDEATEYEKAQSPAPAIKPPARSGPPAGAQAQKPEKKLPGDEEKAAAEKRFAELKGAIVSGIAAGKREQVYVDLAGSASRAQIIGADDAALKVSAMGLEVSLEWTKISPRRFYGIARKYSENHAALCEYCVGFGLAEEAKEEESQKD